MSVRYLTIGFGLRICRISRDTLPALRNAAEGIPYSFCSRSFLQALKS